METWININSEYQVSNLGRIKSLNYHREKREKILKPIKASNGYLKVYIKGKIYSLHRLVAEKFLDNPYNYKEVNHIDGNKQNNNVSNLEFCTRSDNMKHSYKKLLSKPTSKEVICLETGIKYNSIKLAESETGISSSNISNCCNGKRKTAGKYHWLFINNMQVGKK